MKGSYVLLILLNSTKKIEIGKLGKLTFEVGFYTYIGSALNSLENRVKRHLREEKKMYWHIDYFLNFSKIVDVYYSKDMIECAIAKRFEEEFKYIKNFGSSDCKCKSHLFNSEITNIYNLIKNIGLIKWEIKTQIY